VLCVCVLSVCGSALQGMCEGGQAPQLMAAALGTTPLINNWLDSIAQCRIGGRWLICFSV
jgi:hypothetical protein